MRIQITGLGLYLPPHIVTAEDLSSRINRSAEWIESRTGVLRRRFASEPNEAMAAKALQQALGNQRPDLLINAATTPCQLIPDTSIFISRELGWEGVPSMSIHATCLSFLVALQHAAALITAGAYTKVAIVSAEIASRSIDWNEPESAAILGDGAAAALVEPTPDGENSELLAYEMRTYPSGAELAQIEACGTHRHPDAPTTQPEHYRFHMNGPRIYRFAVTRVADVVNTVLGRAGIQSSDLDLTVPHQASGPGVAAGTTLLNLDPAKVVDITAEYGNCIAASMPMALAHAHAQGRLKRGDKILFVGTGAGVSIAAAVLRW